MEIIDAESFVTIGDAICKHDSYGAENVVLVSHGGTDLDVYRVAKDIVCVTLLADEGLCSGWHVFEIVGDQE